MVGVVIIERLHSVNTLLAHQLRCLAVGDAARGIGRSVRPVGADGEDERVRKSLNAERRRQRDLLIAPAEALSPQVDDRFAAHEERKVFPVTRMRARNGSKHAPRFARLTAEAIGEDEDLQIYTSGATNIFKYPELSDSKSASELIEAFEEKQELASLVSETLNSEENTGIQVYIGNETPIQTMKDCSVVTATYELGEGIQGTIGIIGPKRMDYENVMDNLKNLKVQLDDIFRKPKD